LKNACNMHRANVTAGASAGRHYGPVSMLWVFIRAESGMNETERP